jgi:hypothetical protein
MADTEATLWVHSEFQRPTRRAMVWDAAKGRHVKATHEDGQPMFERLPQVGFTGDSVKNLKPTPMRKRARQLLTREGNVIFDMLTEAGAVQVSDAQMAAAIKKANRLGRIVVGTCPLREVFAGLPARSLIAPENKAGAKPCDESDVGYDDEGRPLAPCPHFLAEQKARRAVQFAKNAEQNSSFRDQAVKQLEAQQGQIDALNQVAASTAALVEHFVAKDSQPSAPAPKGPAGK